MRSLKVPVILLLLCLIAPTVWPQGSTPSPEREVMFYVTVMNDRGEWVGGLTPQNFKIREGKINHEISSFSSAESPVSVGILVDASSSSVAFIGRIADAMTYFIKASTPETEYFVLKFDTQQSLLVESTTIGENVLSSLRGLTATPRANTALFDAIGAGVEKLAKGRHAKKALIVFTDAGENSSKQSFEQIRRRLRRSDILLYSLNCQDPSDSASQWGQRGQAWIDSLTKVTGGRSMYPADAKELSEVAYRTGEELRYQYRVGFKPKSEAGAKGDEWRKFEIELNVSPSVKSRVGKMRVIAREGYYVDPTTVK